MLVQRTLQAVVAAVLLVATATATLANYESDIELHDGVLSVDTDDSDDIVHVSREGNEIVVRVFQFHPDERTRNQLEQLLWFNDFDEIEFLAEDSRDGDYDIDDVQMIQIRTYGANDVVYVEEGIYCPVIVATGHDRDVIRVQESERTYLYGEFDGDTIEGSKTGSNHIYGGPGKDYLFGGDEDDFIYGGDGRDAIWGYGGDDELYGDADLDHIRGGDGNDYLEGGYDGKPDYLYGEEGFDKVVGFYFKYIDPKNPNKNWIRTLETEFLYEGEIILGIEIK